jgi:hypothetical protein
MQMTFTDFIAVGALLISAGGLIKGWWDKRHSQPLDDYSAAIKAAREAAETIQSYSDEIKDLRDRIGNLEKESRAKDDLIARLLRGISRLSTQLINDAHLEPCWKPEVIDK